MVVGAPPAAASPPAPDVTRARVVPTVDTITVDTISGVEVEGTTVGTEVSAGPGVAPPAAPSTASTSTRSPSSPGASSPVVATTTVSDTTRSTTPETVVSVGTAPPTSTSTAAASTVPDDEPISPKRVLVIGDSTAAAMRWTGGATDALAGARFTLDLESCRRLVTRSCTGSEGYAPSHALDALQWHAGGQHDTLIVAAGYNDVGRDFADAFDRIVAEARRQRIGTIIWTTYREDVGRGLPRDASSAYADMNDQLRLRMLSGNYPELRLLDWWQYTKSAPSWVVADGVHLTRVGAFGLADLISRELAALDGRACPVAWELFGTPADPCPRPVDELERRGDHPAVLYLYDAVR